MTVHEHTQATWVSSNAIGYLALVVSITTLVVGALCKFLKELCRKFRRKRKKRQREGSMRTPPVVNVRRSESTRSDNARRDIMVQRSDSTSSRVSSLVDFSIPKTRTNVLQQPLPQLSQARTAYATGASKEEKRRS